MMTKNLKIFILITFLGVNCISNVVAGKQTIGEKVTTKKTIIDSFITEFQKINLNIDTAKIVDFSQAASSKIKGYIVVVRGIRKNQRGFEGKWEDELFAVFVVDERMGEILYTLDMFPTRRWYDYRVSIQKNVWDFVIIKGEGDMYSDSSFSKKYDLSVIPPKVINMPKKSHKSGTTEGNIP